MDRVTWLTDYFKKLKNVDSKEFVEKKTQEMRNLNAKRVSNQNGK